MWSLKLLEAINLDFTACQLYENEFIMKMNGRNKLTRGVLGLSRQSFLYSETSMSPLEDEDNMTLGIFY